MPSDNQQPQLARDNFTFEEYSEVIACMGGRVLITDPVQKPWVSESVDMDGIILQQMREGGGSSFEGECEEGIIGFIIRDTSPAEVSGCGCKMGPDNIFVTRPGLPVSAVVGSAFQYITISVPTDRIVTAMESYNPSQTKRLLNGQEMIAVSMNDRDRVVELARTILRTAEDPVNFKDPLARRAAMGELIEALLDAFTSRVTQDRTGGRPRISRSLMLGKIQDYLHQSESRDLSVPALAGQVGVSERTLRTLFLEHFGLSPKKYLQILQIHEVRASLLTAQPGTTVTTVAADHGVWDHGRFANRYRQVFGEAPSKTLASSRNDSSLSGVFAESG